ncbi:YraN family protein [Candidatus Saccharibacteria bacterium]|nr:YraN family protein [Candidatus Saccharibacteria bacterium]
MIEFLRQKGHKILEHDFKTSRYEIDIVSQDFQSVYFTEVKYAKNQSHGSPLCRVDFKKREQVIFAAKCYLKSHPKLNNKNPKIAVAAVTGKDFKIEDWIVLES